MEVVCGRVTCRGNAGNGGQEGWGRRGRPLIGGMGRAGGRVGAQLPQVA